MSNVLRFAPDSDRIADIPDWQPRAKRGLTHRNKKHCYSITSSARVSSVGDSVMAGQPGEYYELEQVSAKSPLPPRHRVQI
jgi:hypothetical protein